jgi:hypothetical protein
MFSLVARYFFQKVGFSLKMNFFLKKVKMSFQITKKYRIALEKTG